MRQGAGGAGINVRIAAMSLIWGLPQGNDRQRWFDTWIKETASAGYDGVTGFVEDFDAFLGEPELLEEKLSGHGLALAALDWRARDGDDSYRRYFDLMAAVGCRLFVCIDPARSGKDYSKWARILNDVGRTAASYGIDVHYHNHTASVGETFTDMQKLLAEIDPEYVKVMLDVGHATKDFVEYPPRERALRFLEAYWDRLNYMEFKDWNETTDLNTPLGEGHADYAGIFTMMKAGGFSGWVTVEQNGNDGASLGRTPLECAKVSREFIRRRLGR